MTPTATQEEDLIILSDTITPTFDQTPIIVEPVKEENSTLISFDTDNLLTSAFDTKPEELNKSTNNELNLDSQVWFLFGETPKQEDKLEQVTSTSPTDNLFWDFLTTWVTQSQEQGINLFEEKSDSLPELPIISDVLNTSSISNDIVDSNEEDLELWDMNSILDTTISKLQKRQTWISSTKSWKLANISDLETQIKELREQVSTLKKEVEDLDEENTKIEVNVSTLESMKLWQSIKVSTKAREHNIKRVAKVV